MRKHRSCYNYGNNYKRKKFWRNKRLFRSIAFRTARLTLRSNRKRKATKFSYILVMQRMRKQVQGEWITKKHKFIKKSCLWQKYCTDVTKYPKEAFLFADINSRFVPVAPELQSVICSLYYYASCISSFRFGSQLLCLYRYCSTAEYSFFFVLCPIIYEELLPEYCTGLDLYKALRAFAYIWYPFEFQGYIKHRQLLNGVILLYPQALAVYAFQADKALPHTEAKRQQFMTVSQAENRPQLLPNTK